MPYTVSNIICSVKGGHQSQLILVTENTGALCDIHCFFINPISGFLGNYSHHAISIHGQKQPFSRLFVSQITIFNIQRRLYFCDYLRGSMFNLVLVMIQISSFVLLPPYVSNCMIYSLALTVC